MVQSTGTKIDNFFIPPFTVDNGDILIIQLPNGPYFTGLLFKLKGIFTGEVKDGSVDLKEKFRFVDHVKESRWRTLIFPLTVKQYIKRYGNPDNEIANKFYEFEGIKPNTKISHLAGSPRKLLALWTTFSWTDKIVFDLAGVDPMGGQRAYDLVKSRIGKDGAAVLIDYCDDFKDDCSSLVKFNLLASEN